MKNSKGFSLVELMVVIAIIGILAAVMAGSITKKRDNRNLSRGYNGTSETRCIDGFKFVIGSNGNAQQILNEQGGGIRCDN